MNPTTCPQCKAAVPAEAKACPQCGREVRGGAAAVQRSCPECNYALGPFDAKCPRCGAKPEEAAAARQFRPVEANLDAEEAPAAPGPPRAAAAPGPPRLEEDLSPVRAPMGAPPPAAARPPAPPLPRRGTAQRPVPKERQVGGVDLRPVGSTAGPAGATDTPWGPAPNTGRGSARGRQNTSGSSGAAPREVMGWNWGAFFLTWMWGIGHNVWIALLALVPGINVIMCFVLGAKGNEWAWENRRFASIAEFKQVQRAWSKWGIGLFAVSVFVSAAVGGVVAFMAYRASQGMTYIGQ